jgi:hypothetical protein
MSELAELYEAYADEYDEALRLDALDLKRQTR